MVITNGFTYIAFLLFLAGSLLALEKYTKWKVFGIVPPLVFIYVLNMIFCTMGVYASEECSATYKALKNNLLYAMIFVMLLRCDFRKLAKLGGRMVAIFLGCSATLFIGVVVRIPYFQKLPRFRCMGCRCRSVCILGRRFCKHGGNASGTTRRCRSI